MSPKFLDRGACLQLDSRTQPFPQPGGHMAKKVKRARKSKSYAEMSIDALFALRDEISEVLSSRTSELNAQLAKLTGTAPKRGRKPGRKGKKVAAQFRSKKDPKLVWSGRGANPRWMKEEMKGTKLTKQSFRIK
jgi:DNA-binding protein H-NS